MSSNPEQFAEMVVMTVKSAMAPLLERLALAEQSSRDLQVKVGELTQVRDRLSAVEVKANLPAPSVDFSPVLERLALSEQVNRELRARVEELSGFRDRVIAIEAKGVAPIVDTAPLAGSIAELTKDFGTMRERVAAVEARQPIPGPAGKDGADGKNGTPGRDGNDGKDGLGFDDLVIGQPDERTIAVKAIRGDRVKELGAVSFPVEIYRGVYVEGKAYERGDCVTWAGSEFHCNEATTTKPEQSKAWTLKVKRGRDGKDGVNGRDLAPVVSVK